MALILARSKYNLGRGEFDSNAALNVEISRYVDGLETILGNWNLNYGNKYFLDISDLINSEFVSSYKYNPDTADYTETQNNILKVKTTLAGNIDGVAQDEIVNTYYASEGYAYSTDSQNKDFTDELKANSFYAGSSEVIYKLKEASLNIPLLNTTLTGLMSNKVANPAFDSATDWSIRPLDVIEDGVLKCGGEFGARNYLGYTSTTGTDYKIKFEISNYVSGSIAFFSGSSGTNISGFVSANGTYEFNYTQDATGSNLFSLYSAAGFEGHIDNVFLGERDSNNFEEINVSARFNGSVVGTKVIEFDADTNRAFQEATFNIDDIDEVYISTDDNVKVLKVNTISECKYSPYILTFRNRFGVDEDLWFFKKSTRQIKVKAEEFRFNQFKAKSSLGMGRDSGLVRQSQQFGKNGTEELTLNSGFVSEALNNSFKQLLLSEKVSLYDFDNNTTEAVKVSQTSLDFKNSINDKLINYTIEIEYSNNIISNII